MASEVSTGNFGSIINSAVAIGEHANASIGQTQSDESNQVIALVEELIRQVDRHWGDFVDPGEIRSNLQSVDMELRASNPDHNSIRSKLTLVAGGMAPVAAMAALANSILDLINHVH